tara:strand:- start:1269 stop:1802 length:534 start_codon:yes stop_codon:yes gene_type:complete
MSKVKIAVLESQVNRLLEKQKELTERVRANEKVVAAIGLLGSVVIAIIGTGIFQKAEACSPPLDGSEFTCPPHDGVVLRHPSSFLEEEEEPKYIRDWNTNRKVILLDSREDKPLVIMETYQHIMNAMRDWKNEQERTTAEDSINNALAEMEWNYGSDDPTESEELLQLPSDGDQPSS